MNSFSSRHRQEILDKLSQSSFDLIVIGGGITGAGIALDAVTRGLKVALIEMQDFASGTSGRSTKLIHGGLRYLKNLEFKLVAEVGRERAIIHRIASHITKPEPMLLPIVKHGSLGKYSTRFAMWLYEYLAGVKKEEAYKFLEKDEVKKREPCFKDDELLGGILFYEYRTDDARLTIEVMKEAVSRGAVALNYVKANEFIYQKNKISGIKANDQLSGITIEVNAKCVVNAGGPWVDQLDKMDNQKVEYLILTKGVHVVVDHSKLPVKQAMYFDTFDKRMIFIIPRDGKTYIGTTDTFYMGDLKEPEVTQEDADYLLRCVNENFPGCRINTSDIESSWAGLRPLIKKTGKNPSEISRKDELYISPSGLITIAGGKLTGYRKMAERAVDKVVGQISDRVFSKCITDSVVLSGGQIETSLESFVAEQKAQGTNLGLSERESEDLIRLYGSNIRHIYEIVNRIREEKSDIPLSLRAQIIYAVEFEICVSPADFFIRRTSLLYFNKKLVVQMKDAVILYMRDLLSWDPMVTERFRAELQKRSDSA